MSALPRTARRWLVRVYNEPMSGRDELKPAAPGVKLTYEDLLLFPDDGKRHELIDGEHYVTPPPNIKHQTIVTNLGGMIWNYLQEHRVGRMFNVTVDVVLSNFDVVEPDVQFISRAREGILTKQNVRGAPDLVVEVGSPRTRKRDETIKRRLYERFGVSEYWVIDPELDTIKVYRRVDEHYVRAAELSLENGDVLTTPQLPGLEMPLSKIFED